MYAIVDITGHQYKIEKDQTLFVHKLEGNEGDVVELKQVLLTDDNGKVKVGNPSVKGAKVTAKILEQVKGDKVIVFKKKRRKGYKKKNGHRQLLSKIQIEEIKK
jgi:large subunit ribosomal protein L21